jgi:DNA-binding MurR/RpiR family transcriptional regulator
VTPLVKIRSERDQMSAIERRIADFILENARLLRDYSSQQLADALGISQSSVVKFSQKLGFKGYPDLKFSIGEAVARENGTPPQGGVAAAPAHPQAALAEDLWRGKSRSEEATRLINPPEQLGRVAAAVDGAARILVIGLGEDDILARSFAMKLSRLGIPVAHHADPLLLEPSVESASPGDLLVAFSEHGKQPELGQLARLAKKRRARVVSATRNTANPLRAQADAVLLVSAHDERPQFAPLLYQSAALHLLDLLVVLLSERNRSRAGRAKDGARRIHAAEDR